MNFWWYVLLFGFPFAGGLIGWFIKKHNPAHLKLFLAFSGAFLFSVTIISLIPELYHHHETDGIKVGYLILGGFFLQILIDVFSGGVEHGHVHRHTENVSLRVFLALAVHAFLEGMAGGSGFFETHAQHSFLWGIALHEVPAAFALMVVLKSENTSSKWLLPIAALYALMTPAGAYLADHAGVFATNAEHLIPYIVAVVIGVFLHISTTILFENSEHHRFSFYKIIAVLMGASVAILSGGLH